MKLKRNVLVSVLMAAAGLLLLLSVRYPMWRIELDAPQYPEGLVLQLHADKIGGDVAVINGLNHYIGMKTLHTEDFWEFGVLKYVIWGFSVLFFFAAAVPKKLTVYAALGLFVGFAVLAGIDFYRWNYEYGHNLDPNAAIIVPGMAYQPPLLGYKKLLNFGAYSIPDVGGWLLIVSGLLAAVSAGALWRSSRVRDRRISTVVLVLMGAFTMSCGPKGPRPVVLNQDACGYCKMSISELHFAAELMTQKGRIYVFDDLSCMQAYVREKEPNYENIWIANYNKPEEWLDAENAIYIKSPSYRSPMGGNTAAYADLVEAEKAADEYRTVPLSWSEIRLRE